ncbi:S-layer homology domain-containing protein [Aminipila sp.]|uniref:S-layer homology domain-containing protein n=1 Tax=Aminipila sp. TaxID=2060095 RepID=UPI0028968FB9|nr:S-layer homology domain-containing protein [Aminipila sp.]
MKRTKKLVSIVLTMAMVLCYIPAIAFASESTNLSFVDMPNNWSTEGLKSAVSNGLIKGYEADNGLAIKPMGNLSRAEMVTMVNRAFGAADKASLSGVVDVKDGAWYAEEMAKAVQMGTMKTSLNMRPNDKITRQEAFTVLARAYKMECSDEKHSSLNNFVDKGEIAAWAEGSLCALIDKNYLTGNGGYLKPKENITRAEFTKIMDNLVKQYINQAGTITQVAAAGNVMVNVANVTLKDVTINGDLIIGDGVGSGDVTLENVIVTGKTIVRGGGSNSVLIKGKSKIVDMIIAKINGNIRIAAIEDAIINNLFVVDGKENVKIEGKVGNANITMEVSTIFQNASVSKLIIDSSANVKIDEKSNIIYVAAKGKANLTNYGNIETYAKENNKAVLENKGKVNKIVDNLQTTPAQPKPNETGSKNKHHSSNTSNIVENPILTNIISTLGNNIEGEEAFDYVSYVYLGWRTTGGPWQNQVIEDFLINKLKNAGFTYSDTDKSSELSGDSVWIQQDNSSETVWAPDYARLEVTSTGNKELIDAFNVESYAFDPTSPTYINHYKELYGIENIDNMYNWILEKNGSKRVNVENKLEAELNKRAHLTWQTCFTDETGTTPQEAKGVEGEVVYVGTIKAGVPSKYSGDEANLEGKVLLCDSSNKTNFAYAKKVKAVAVMSTASLDKYNTPTINGEQWYKDSARYRSGVGTNQTRPQTEAGSPIVEWNLSLNQKEAMLGLLKEAETTGNPVKVKSVSIGRMYDMDDASNGAKGQLTAIAEIKGTSKADERILFMAHVQEPGANDNSTGVGLNLELVLKLKAMIDKGTLPRPERTMTFIWGDEMTCAELWLNAHPTEKSKVVCAIDLDMVGENSELTGGVMRIEKTPDPSAVYNYSLDVLPGEPAYSDDEAYVRLPDSHTLWGAGDLPEAFKSGFYLNDLYMASATGVIKGHDSKFKVDVCPYEGGSDHTVFLEAGVPALLTWHFTDYVYHTSVDTLSKVSAAELENVGITSLATGYMAANAKEAEAKETMGILYKAAEDRFNKEALNTAGHYTWSIEKGKDVQQAKSLEKEILTAWGDWYKEAIESCGSSLLGTESTEYQTLEAEYVQKINNLLVKALDRVDKTYV